MKKFHAFIWVLVSLFVLCALNAPAYAASKDKTTTIAINETNFPDDIFRDYVSKNFDSNADGNLSSAEIKLIEAVEVNGMGISSLKGIEHFTGLKWLNCENNSLAALDVTKNTILDWLNCKNNRLTALNVTKNTLLTGLDCSQNQLKTLNVTKNLELTNLYCSENQLTALNVTKNTKLKELICWRNQIKTLTLTKNTALENLHCDENQLTALNLTKNTKLRECYIGSNGITSLNVTKNTALEDFQCNGLPITALNLTKNTKLKILYCEGVEKLTKLDLSKNVELIDLYCSYNTFTALDLSKNEQLRVLESANGKLKTLTFGNNYLLREVNCMNNQLTKLDVSSLHYLKYLHCAMNKIKTLDVSNNERLQTLDCNYNQLTKLTLGDHYAIIDYLECEGNKLTQLDISGCNVRRLFLDNGVNVITAKIEGTLPKGTVGQKYENTVNIKGGSGPYDWIGSTGTLPNGLKFTFENDRATLAGTPTKSGKFSFYLIVSDSEGLITLRKFSVTIATAKTTSSKSTSSEAAGVIKNKTSTAQTEKTQATFAVKENNQTSTTTSSKSSLTLNAITLKNSAPADTKSEANKNEGHGVSFTVLNVINEDKIQQGTGKDEDFVTVRANKPVNFFIDKWLMKNGTEADVSNCELVVYIDEKPAKNIKISDSGVFTLPPEIVKDCFKVQAKALSKNINLETIELFISAE